LGSNGRDDVKITNIEMYAVNAMAFHHHECVEEDLKIVKDIPAVINESFLLRRLQLHPDSGVRPLFRHDPRRERCGLRSTQFRPR
jgi:hypothetical protein